MPTCNTATLATAVGKPKSWAKFSYLIDKQKSIILILSYVLYIVLIQIDKLQFVGLANRFKFKFNENKTIESI